MATIFRAPVVASIQPARPKAAAFDTPNLLLSVLVVVAPFTALEWSAPRPVSYVQRQYDPPVLLATTLKPPATALFQAFIHPTPPARLPRATSFDPPNLLLAELVPTIPFFEPLWTSAHRPQPKVATFDPPNILAATLKATTPFQAFIWPNPYARRPKALAFDAPYPFATAAISAAIWTPVAAISSTWTATSPTSGIWTPQSGSAPPWTGQ